MMETGGTKRISVHRNWGHTNTLELPTFFTMREIDFIRESIPPVEAFNASLNSWSRLSNGGNVTGSNIIGTLPDFAIVNEWTVSEGRFLSHFDYINANDVIVLGTTVKDELFGPRDAIGQYITLDNKRLMVIGIMTHRSMESFAANFSDGNPLEYMNTRSFIPLSTMIKKLRFDDRIDGLSIRVWNEEDSIPVKNDVDAIILGMRRGERVFNVTSAFEDMNNENDTAAMFKIIFFFISSVSMITGGIVVMNIMLATIKERTREIGVRLTVGARRFDILAQFLIQTVFITFSGGVLGVIFALFSLDYIGAYLGLPAKPNFEVIVIALSVSIVVGLFFGIFPAVKASKLDPVIALRNE
jgi:putative ABC transport system permease protein